jgi:Kef-type K+ transport system membrane component KefB/ubiquinone/menaquinone biosynthesis C-methylase UbiE
LDRAGLIRPPPIEPRAPGPPDPEQESTVNPPDTVTAATALAEPRGEVGFGRPATRTRKAAAYAVLVIVPAIAVLVILSRAGLSGAAGTGGAWRIPALPTVARLLLALTVILAVTRTAGALFRRFGQPAVLGEIAGGIALGPSLLQTVWPQLGTSLFSPSVISDIDIVAQVGVALFVFSAGLELRASALTGRASTLAVIGHAGMAVPLLCGTVFGVAAYSSLASGKVGEVPFALFLGLAISVTALPVLARILDEHELTATRLGSTVLACAAMNDVVAWCVLALVLALAGAGSLAATATTVVFTVVFSLGMVALGVWLHRGRGTLARRVLSSGVGVVLVAVLLISAVSDWGGLDTVFGAFLLGAAVPAESALAHRFRAASGLLQPLLLPVFFAESGLRTDFIRLGTDATLWGWCALVVLLAFATKVGSTALAARAVGVDRRSAVRIGGLMNCRGLTEIIVLNAGLTAGLIDVTVFSMFVIMALVCTAATGLFLRGLGRESTPIRRLGPRRARIRPFPLSQETAMTAISEHESITGAPARPVPAAGAPLDMQGLAWIHLGHAAFQHLNAACELNLFEFVADHGSVTKAEVGDGLGLQERATDILLLGVTSLGMLTVSEGEYRLATVLAELLKTDDWRRFKDIVAFEQYIVYEGQRDFTESLRTNSNAGLRRIPGTGRDLYHRLSENPHLERVFYRYMRAWSELANEHMVTALDLTDARRLLDVGGGDAVNAIALAEANEHLAVTVLDIDETVPITEAKIAEADLSERVDARALDILNEPLPTGYDVVLFAHQLVIWTLEQNTALLKKAYDVLPEGGRVVIFNSMSADAGDGPTVAGLLSVYFATLPAEGGMIYSWAQHEQCLAEAGFGDFQRTALPGWTPRGVLVARKLPRRSA